MTSSLLSPSQIGDVNRSRVLRVLCDQGPLSRAELAKHTGVTRATIGNIVQALIDGGLLDEGQPITGKGRVGKPGRPVWFGPRAGRCIAVAIHADAVEAAIVNARGDVVDRARRAFAVPGADGPGLVAAVVDAVSTLPARGDLLGIGVAVPGVCDTATGTVIGSGQLPGLAGTALTDSLRERFGRRVLIDNDARAQALGEKWFGQGRGRSSFISLQTGHGLNAGVVLGGAVFRGSRGLTGEVGHACVDPDGAPCRCGLRGCWETIASLGWLREEATKLRLPGADALDAAALMALCEQIPEAEALADRYATNLAFGLANLAQVLDPQLMILHGDVVGGGEELRRRIEERVRRRVLGYLRPTIEVVLSTLDQQATLLGAAGVVLSETFSLTS